MDEILVAQDVSKEFKGKSAVSHVTIGVRSGRIMGLLGPNGAGKSTTLRMMCGLIQPTSGSVDFKGEPLEKWKSSLYTHLSCVLEDSSLTYMFLTGWNNLAYQGALYGFSRKEAFARSQSLMDALALAEHMDKPVGDWSRGTQQKLALVTAMLPRPQVLILDEPTLGLDVVAKRDFLNAIKELARRGMGIIISSHQSEVIEEVADDITLISHGHIQWQGVYQDFIDAHSQQMGAAEGVSYDLEKILLALFDEQVGAGEEGEDD
ncbi:ABC transporter, ATP-binding protein [Parascardovia denticolens DSM 10105 = JCM 12538]|uniref:ABC transporter, ATP-binding protein n=1 Tax=Parascardovia denticolens DSM 10105 = JCM 12538 TaxID=864564 RepID=E6K077_PARDN|nr:ABC transporter ATP-binding protein [Parascardovia denticolens]EFG32907.1 hypothetical protein HMPREF9017_00312 [Parascardovia denticolens F0305]EFT83268.1 ABC transporter, ATP-binding protein [Parascardovia denticolens DSM 10105 = JCM 12538]BAR05831.1 ABC transporter ATP-binding component [Parascardovia denticolens DSM 10105 = JCM 12538]